MSVFMPVPYCFDYCSMRCSLKSGSKIVLWFILYFPGSSLGVSHFPRSLVEEAVHCSPEHTCTLLLCVHTSMHAQSLSCVHLFVTLWPVAHQAPLSMEFFRQEYWRGLPFPSPGDVPDPGIEPSSPVLAGTFFYH